MLKTWDAIIVSVKSAVQLLSSVYPHQTRTPRGKWGREHFKRGLFLDKNSLFPRSLSYQRSLPVQDSRPRESLSVQDAYSEIVHPTYARLQTPESISQGPYPVQRLPTHSLV